MSIQRYSVLHLQSTWNGHGSRWRCKLTMTLCSKRERKLQIASILILDWPKAKCRKSRWCFLPYVRFFVRPFLQTNLSHDSSMCRVVCWPNMKVELRLKYLQVCLYIHLATLSLSRVSVLIKLQTSSLSHLTLHKSYTTS